jgi:hypothetical protein
VGVPVGFEIVWLQKAMADRGMDICRYKRQDLSGFSQPGYFFPHTCWAKVVVLLVAKGLY